MGKIQNHLGFDGVSWHWLDKKTNMTWQRRLFPFSYEGETQRNLCLAGNTQLKNAIITL